MSLANIVVNSSIKRLTRILCKIDDGQLVKVPEKGPLIIACNHINFMEVPLLYTHLQPRNITGFAKAETWENPVMGLLFNLWGAIPIQRGEADTKAFRRAVEALNQEKILAIAPEGTRSGNGRLGQGFPGIVMLALRTAAPILPLVYYGGERFYENINRLRRTDFHIRVGKPFRLSPQMGATERDTRAIQVDEIMYQLAKLLPEEYRGYYSDLSRLTTNYINFA